MSSGRRSARRQAVFILYQRDLLELGTGAALERASGTVIDKYARSLVLGVSQEQPVIDAMLQEHLSGWSIDRLGALERSILRLGVYELLWESEMPEAVAIDEAVELAKRFCSDEAGSLVNGVLGSLAAAKGAQSSGRDMGESG